MNIDEAFDVVLQLKKKVGEVNKMNQELWEDNTKLTKAAKDLEERCAELQAANQALSNQVSRLLDQVRELTEAPKPHAEDCECHQCREEYTKTVNGKTTSITKEEFDKALSHIADAILNWMF